MKSLMGDAVGAVDRCAVDPWATTSTCCGCRSASSITMRTGEIISRIGDAVKIRAFINDVAINLLVNGFIVVFSFGLMFTYYWKLARWCC